MVVLLYKSGIPVKLTGDFTKIRYDIEGFLIEFTHQGTVNATKYNFYFKSDFKKVDQKRNDLEEGYYVEEQYQKYIENTRPNIPSSTDMIYNFKFNFTNYIANSGDLISVQVTNFGAQFDVFYDRTIYNFTIESNNIGQGVQSYSQPILDGFESIDYKLRLPSLFQPLSVLVPNQLNSPGFHFYAKNLGDFINNLANDIEKRKFKKITILIVFKIRYIVREIFPLLINNSGFTIQDVDDIANNTSVNLSGNSTNALKEMLFILKKTWGYYYNPSSTLPHRSSLPVLFNTQSTYTDYEYYYIGLTSFYRKCYRIPYALSVFPNEMKYDYLIEILSINGLSILPISVIKETLLKIIKENSSINEELEQLVVRLVLSISQNQANDFLDFLLEQENCTNTNFERLFALLDDARIERIPIASWLADEKKNRMAFVYAVHELWKVSKYNLLGSNQEVNQQSYFLTDGINYFKNPAGNLKPIVLECGRLSSGTSGNPAIPLQTNTWVAYETDKTLIKELVTIYKNVDITNLYLSSSGQYLGTAENLNKNYKTKTQYHLYQPIILMGHQQDDRVILPNKEPIPAFLFYYTDDFERLLKIDAQIALTVNIGIEVVLFFTFGGVSQLRHLQHLKYFTKIQGALSGTLPVGEEILVWAGLEAGAQTTSITASMIYSLGQYNATILPTDAERKAREEANKAFLYMTLAFAGATAIFRYKAVQAAEYALIDMAGTVTMSPVVKSVMQTLVSQNVNAVLSFGDRLTNLSLNEANVIITRYSSYSQELKKVFYRDFGQIKNTETAFWNALNKTSSLDNYEALRNLNILERNEAIVFSSTKLKNAYVRYYSEQVLRVPIERVGFRKTVIFLDNYGTQTNEWFNYLKNDPTAIKRWDKLSASGKLFAKTNPEIWLYRFDRLYQNFAKFNRLSDAEILQRFGQNGLDLVNEIEAFALNHISTATKNQLLRRDILMSGMKDKVTGISSDFFVNFSEQEILKNGGVYESYTTNMFPNLKKRVDDIWAFKKQNYNMADFEYLKNTGDYPGAHAEIRALNDLARKKFGSTLVSDQVFDAWLKNDVLGYNRNIQYGTGQQNIIMNTCADCFHITDLVTFIKPQ